MAKFKQLDILTMEQEQSTTSGTCYDNYGDAVSPTPSPNNAAGCLAASVAAGLDGGYVWEGDDVINLTNSRAVTINLETISSFKAFRNPNTGADDVSKTEITLTGNEGTLIVNETLADFMAVMAVGFKG